MVVYLDGQIGEFARKREYTTTQLMMLRPLNDKRSYLTLEKMQGIGFKK